jgi:hypothetical protein
MALRRPADSLLGSVRPRSRGGDNQENCEGFVRIASWICKVITGTGLASYAVFSAVIGALYLPLRSGIAAFMPIWSRERTWAFFDGPDCIVLSLALLLIAMSVFIRPVAGTPHWNDAPAARRESSSRLLLRLGVGLFLLGLILWIPLTAHDPVPATVESIRAAIRAERSRDAIFHASQPWWGVILTVSIAALLTDLVLCHRSEHRRWRPQLRPGA